VSRCPAKDLRGRYAEPSGLNHPVAFLRFGKSTAESRRVVWPSQDLSSRAKIALSLATPRRRRLRAISSLIGEALTGRASNRALSPLFVINAKRDAVRVAEIELG
jgi:hypothetical protein